MKPTRSLAITAYRLSTSPYRIWRLRQSMRNNEVPIAILFYHRVADYAPTPWTIDCRTFERQLRWLKRHFEFISLDEAQRRIRVGNSRPAVCITFDDGYEDNADFALPLLASWRIPTMYFVTQGFLDHPDPFPHDAQLGLELRPNRAQTLRRWVGSSIEFGGHTRTHRDLGTTRDLEVLYDEMIEATADLAAQLGTPIEHFAFPFGHPQHTTELAFELARQSGLKSVATAHGGWNHIGQSPWHLQRMHGDPSMSRLKNWLTGDPRTLRVAPASQAQSRSRERINLVNSFLQGRNPVSTPVPSPCVYTSQPAVMQTSSTALPLSD